MDINELNRIKRALSAERQLRRKAERDCEALREAMRGTVEDWRLEAREEAIRSLQSDLAACRAQIGRDSGKLAAERILLDAERKAHQETKDRLTQCRRKLAVTESARDRLLEGEDLFGELAQSLAELAADLGDTIDAIGDPWLNAVDDNGEARSLGAWLDRFDSVRPAVD